MAQRIDLRAYQESIATRLAAAQSGAGVPALLGIESAGVRWLVDLPAAGEVLPLPALAPVPLTQAWFAGLASVHGELQAVVDFAAFQGAAPTSHDAAARLLRIGARLGGNVALLVARVHGLKRTDALFRAEAGDDTLTPLPAWYGARFTDAQGESWVKLDLERLLADPVILDAVLREI